MRETRLAMDSLRRSFKSHGSSSRNGRQEALPMLFEDELGKRSEEVVVRVDGDEVSSGSKIDDGDRWTTSSPEFWKVKLQNPSSGPGMETDFNFRQPPVNDPPSKMIEESSQAVRSSPTDHSKDLRVSFQAPMSRREEISPGSIVRRRSKGSAGTSSSDEGEERQNHGKSALSGQVLKCSSNSSFKRASTLMRTKTKSRLQDPPQQSDDPKSGKLKSGPLKSEMLSRPREEEEDDPFLDDVPDEFREYRCSSVTFLQWISLIVILAALVCSLAIPSLEAQTVWGLSLWKWEVLVLVLICGRLLSGWGMHLVVFCIERNFMLRKRVLYFVYGLRKPVQNCLWLGLVLVAWDFMFYKAVEMEANGKMLQNVNNVLICLLVGTVIWLAKTLLVKVLASSFHVSTYFDRIQDALFNQYVIQTLSGPPLVKIQLIKDEEEKDMAEVQILQNAGVTAPADQRAATYSSKSIKQVGSEGLPRSSACGKSFRFSDGVSKRHDEVITIDHLHRLNQKNVSAWNMKRLINIARHGVLSTLDERLIEMDREEDESALHIRSEHEAKKAAKKIFYNVAQEGSKYIFLDDLMRFMQEDEVFKTMSLFEGANKTKRVSKTDLKTWVIAAFIERRSLSLTLNDTKTAVKKLHHMVNVVVGIVIIIIWLLILEIATTHFLVLISSQLLLVVFIFGNTCKTIFEAIIFLFVMHPFDVGDRCEIDGVQMIVEEMNILTTIFLRYDNQKISYPNSVLSTKPISNIYRSPDMNDTIDFCIHVATPVEKIAIMKERIKRYVESKNEHWHPDPAVLIKELKDMNRLNISVWLKHRMNHQNARQRWLRREFVVQEMIQIFKELDIECKMLPLEVNLRNMPALSSNRMPSTWAT